MNTVRIPIDSAELDGELIIPPAAEMGNQFAVVVSHGGRPDLAGAIELNQQAHALMHCKKKLTLIPGATHLFEEPGTSTAADWFVQHL